MVTKKKEEKAAATKAAPAKTAGQKERSVLRRTNDGIVVSAQKTPMTAVVEITRQVRHAKYGKYIRRSQRYTVHDKKSECGIGDRVRIVETRPMSRHKHWRVEKV